MDEKYSLWIRRLVYLTWKKGGWTRAGEALGMHREALRRLGRRKPPPIHLALRLRDVLGFPLAFWVDGIPKDLDPRTLLPHRRQVPPARTWNDVPPSFEPHGRGLAERIRRAGCSLSAATELLGGSRTGLRFVLNGRHAPNVRLAFLAWRHFGFIADWWRLTEPPESPLTEPPEPPGPSRSSSSSKA